jgi:putative membrane protein
VTAPDHPAADRGAAAERTRLAWSRTALAFAGCTLVLARVLQERLPAAGLAAALAGLAVAAALAGRAEQRYRAAPGRDQAAPAAAGPAAGSRPGPAPGLLLAVTAAVCGLAATAAVVAVAIG